LAVGDRFTPTVLVERTDTIWAGLPIEYNVAIGGLQSHTLA
jgi:hypothetical protein